jgi:hypothetical protein
LEELLGAGGIGDVSLEDLPGVDVSGTTLSLGPAAIDLPVLIQGMRYDSARIVGGDVRLTFNLGRTSLRLN